MALTQIFQHPAAAAGPAQAELPAFRNAPHNIEAEQALLGAILVNNEALDRVSGFLEPLHFYDPLHAQIYETTAKLIQAGKLASPTTLKTFFEKLEPLGEMTVPQYLGRLVAQATTIINSEHYGRTIYDLAVRRQLIMIGEDIVNRAYEVALDATAQQQIEVAEEARLAVREFEAGRGMTPSRPSKSLGDHRSPSRSIRVASRRSDSISRR